jgi:hypothetical protein
LPETEQTELAGEGIETVLLTEKMKTETQNGRRERKHRQIWILKSEQKIPLSGSGTGPA